MSEKSRLYKDFDPNKTPNTIWTFETDDDGNNTFEEVVCSHAISGDTDSVTGDSKITVGFGLHQMEMRIDDFFEMILSEPHKVVKDEPGDLVIKPTHVHKKTVLGFNGKVVHGKVVYLMRHTVTKQMFEIHHTDESKVTVTADHSIMVVRDEELIEVKPSEIQHTDEFVMRSGMNTYIVSAEDVAVKDLGVRTETVYDVEVNGIHNFFANDILVHNSCYCKFPENFTSVASEDELVKAADIIASRVNDAYPSFLERAFNCPSSRNDSMVSEREIVSDATLIVTKKRYAMHVINDEGKKVDKLKIMGLEIKKADTSPIVKEILHDMVKRILAGQSRHQLKQSIEDFKQRFFESDPHDIALPCGCKTLVKAQKQLRETGSLKGIHYVSKAAVFYNSKCGPKDAKVRAGDKVGLLYIKHGESKYIGFPRDATMLPEWLDDIVVDYDTMWKKAETKITNYLKSMGWDIATINKQRRNDMFGF